VDTGGRTEVVGCDSGSGGDGGVQRQSVRVASQRQRDDRPRVVADQLDARRVVDVRPGRERAGGGEDLQVRRELGALVGVQVGCVPPVSRWRAEGARDDKNAKVKHGSSTVRVGHYDPASPYAGEDTPAMDAGLAGFKLARSGRVLGTGLKGVSRPDGTQAGVTALTRAAAIRTSR
jgi:hypothetical protein